MFKKIFLWIFLFCFCSVKAQELNCNLVVNAQQTGNENVQVFKTLEKQLSDFVNNTTWTNKEFEPFERIDCSMVITIIDYDSDSFQATIQIQSARPVHNSNYSTPVYNFNDRDFNFKYLEYQNLNFNSKQFESNLISVIAFHAYIILGMDADTFELNGGQNYFNIARDIANYSQIGNIEGWQPARGGDQSRRALIDQIMSKTYSEFRTVLYDYHRNGLDIMSGDIKEAKNSIASTLSIFNNLYKRRPNSFVARVFFDAKVDEITDIFSAGPSVKISDLVSVLTKVAPIYSSNWKKIKF
jgi:hypothetical protein